MNPQVLKRRKKIMDGWIWKKKDYCFAQEEVMCKLKTYFLLEQSYKYIQEEPTAV